MKFFFKKKEIADGYDRYSEDEDAQHEAGYDAFMTGSIFIGFARFILECEGNHYCFIPLLLLIVNMFSSLRRSS